MAKQIITANGLVDAADIGGTLVHEHLVLGYDNWEWDACGSFDEEKAIELATKNVLKAKAHGVNTIVDAWPNDPGRKPNVLREVQKRTGVNIICTTGSHNDQSSSHQYWDVLLLVGHEYALMLEHVAKSMIRDIREGMCGTDVKAGLIKVGTYNYKEFSRTEKLFMEAAAIAQQETGVNIITHTEHGLYAVEQAKLMIAAGADPKKISIGHLGSINDISYLEALLDTGVYLSEDQFGIPYENPNGDAGMVETVAELVKRGWGNRIMLSHDACTNVVLGYGLHTEKTLANMPNWHLCGIPTVYKPMFLEKGLTEAQFNQMFIDAPTAFFSN